MSSSEKFCLRWNDFESNISVAFREIREEKDFFDCTLSVGDRQIQAHKLILSACSPFFRGVLRNNPHAHPLLYLKGVAFSDLAAVLNFMYHGEVNVAQEELNSFLAVAEDLKVKGLTQSNNSKSTPPPPSAPPSRPPAAPRPRSPPRHSSPAPIKRPRPSPQQQSYPDDDIQEVEPVVKTEPITPMTDPAPLPHSYNTPGQESALAHMEEGAAYTEDGYDYGGYEDEAYGDTSMVDTGGEQNKGREAFFSDTASLDAFIDANTTTAAPSQGWVCCICGRTAINRLDIKRHVESKHCSTMGFSCDVAGCGAPQGTLHKTRHSLATHKRLKHGITDGGTRTLGK